ncbi:MAG: four helix bundle protein [Prevotella sp.]|nr:four helix bundle protein [Prevotella sp.]
MDDFYYRKLNVYHLSKQLVIDIYSISKKFPASEQFGLTNQIQRAAVSIPSNIAEGMGRFSIKERIHHLEFSLGSLMEVMCQLEIAESLNYISANELTIQEGNIKEISKMLTGLRRTFEEKNNNN